MKESGEVYRQPRRQASVFPLYDIDNIAPVVSAPEVQDVDARLSQSPGRALKNSAEAKRRNRPDILSEHISLYK